MKFKLIATHLMYRCNHIDDAPVCLRKYIEKIKNADASLELPEPVIEHNQVFITLMYGSQFFNLAKILDKELIIRTDDEPTIEIYDDWRE